MTPDNVIIRNIGLLATCDGVGSNADEQLGLVRDAVVWISGGTVQFLGPKQGLPHHAAKVDALEVDADGGFVGPGLVDCHTHVVFAGDRSFEFEARCSGKSYLDIANAGGGIQHTVRATRAAPEATLVADALPRLNRLFSHGVTTAEVKSGYGLDLSSEIKMLRAIASLNQQQPISLHATAMPLHVVPLEFAQARGEYLTKIVTPLLEQIHEEKLATAVDAFVEQSAFTKDESSQYLKAARRLGFGIHLHVDQLTSGAAGAEWAAAEGAWSASHLEQISTRGIRAISASHTVAVLAPASTLFARVRPYAPGRALVDGGATVALCTNVNPGSSLSENVALTMSLACLENGLTPAEAYLAFTRNGGLALRSPSLGRLKTGNTADLVTYRANSYRDLPYHLATSLVREVFKGGTRFVI
jgi:imidazolonepropionase